MTEEKKKNVWKIILPIAIVLVICCVCLVAVGIVVYMGTQGTGPLASLLEGDNPITPILQQSTPVGDWDLYYSWDCTSYSGPVTVSLFDGGGMSATEGGSTGYGTWWQQGNILDYQYDSYPNAHYTGTFSGTHYEGTMVTDDGSNGCFYADMR